jgi:hypothetical protein
MTRIDNSRFDWIEGLAATTATTPDGQTISTLTSSATRQRLRGW